MRGMADAHAHSLSTGHTKWSEDHTWLGRSGTEGKEEDLNKRHCIFIHMMKFSNDK